MPFYFIAYYMYQFTFILPAHTIANETLNVLYMYWTADDITRANT